ncbi:MAG: glycosyltransferase family 39 protein, partial [Romboutsia sp.]|nr:glycosyltransferase family 39 protein [Romboutsia sp.]
MLKSKLSKIFEKSRNTEIRLLFVVFLIALFFRLYGIKHGFPLITHPDEPSVIRSALGLRFELNPKHFDWPHMYFYINYIVFTLFIKFRGLLLLLFPEQTLNNIFPLLNRDPLVFYYISRVLTAIFGGLTIFPVYGAAKELFNKKTAIFSALVFALIPFHIRHSHYAFIDVPMTFWVAMSLYFSARIYNSPKLSNYIFAGLTIGFAASTKYNGGLLAFVVFLAHIFRIYRSNSTLGLGQKILSFFGFNKGEKVFDLNELKLLLLSAVSAVIGFVLGTPYALFDYSTFSRTDGPQGAYWQFTNVGKVPFIIQLQQLFDGILFKLSDDLGYTFLIIFFLVLALFIIKSLRNRKFFIDNLSLALILFPAVFILFYISGFEKARS